MKTYKKLLVGLVALAVILPAVFMFINTPAARAAPSDKATSPDDIENCMKSAKFISVAEIDCTFKPVGADQKITIHFFNHHPDAGNDGGGPFGYSSWQDDHYYEQQETFFAQGQDEGHGRTNRTCSGPCQQQINGISVEDPDRLNPNGDNHVFFLSQDYARKHLNLVVNLRYTDTKTNQVSYPCQDFQGSMPNCNHGSSDLSTTDDMAKDGIGHIVDGDRTAGIANLLQFQGQNVVSLDNVTEGNLSGLGYGLDASYKDGPLFFTNGFDSTSCSGDILWFTSPDQAQRAVLTKNNEDLSKNYPKLLAYLKFNNASGCGVQRPDSGSNQQNFYGITTSFGINGTVPKLSDGNGDGGTTKGGKSPANQSGDTCGGPSGALNWVMCPLLLGAQDGANFLLDGFEGLLSFNVNQDLGNTSSQASVKKTWELVRNLATAFLVILMLIMVFSQAISAGPFDAYTVRKMLPRLIAVAIAIQLSWAIVSWAIGIFDDMGKGIANIMYWPFGGADNLDLQSLLANAGVSSGAATAISWVGIVALLGIGLAALPATLLLVLAAVAALFTAYFTLVMRKIIIIVLLIFAPIAMLAYILPNTQKYWKMWYDNLIKILFMFPLIVIMISTGRIFAYISGGQGGNHTGGALNFVLVMVAFFGPLFLLPKTYKWGGQAMSIASGAVGGIANRYAGRESALGKGVQGYGERWQGEKAKQYDPTANGYQRFKRRLQSGHVLPTQRSRRLAIAAGDKWANDRNDEANALVTRTQEKAMAGYDVWEVDEHGRRVKKTLTGVEAGKQALVDLSGLEGGVANERAAQAAQKKLLETSSEIEMQKSVIQSGPNAGKRVSETTSFRKNIASSPEHYSMVNKSRFDFAPDLQDSAENDTGLKYATATGDDKKKLDRRRLEIAIDRMTPENMQNTHYGFYQDVAATGDVQLSRKLAAKIHDFAQNGGTIGSSAAGSLRGGRQPYVDQALALAGPDVDLARITVPGAPPPPPPTP